MGSRNPAVPHDHPDLDASGTAVAPLYTKS